MAVPDHVAAAAALRAHALSLPGVNEEFPWGDRVVKVHRKIFVFLGRDVSETTGICISVKLPQSHPEALLRPGITPTGYGLGKAGWVTVRIPLTEEPNVPELCAWINESYRAIAPKRLVGHM